LFTSTLEGNEIFNTSAAGLGNKATIAERLSSKPTTDSPVKVRKKNVSENPILSKET
jgi:hypothetical protein